MKHKKELMLLIVLTIFLSLVYVAYGEQWCYFSNDPSMQCIDMDKDPEITNESACINAGAKIPYEGECTKGCCCVWNSFNKKYEQQMESAPTKALCLSFPNNVFNPSISSP